MVVMLFCEADFDNAPLCCSFLLFFFIWLLFVCMGAEMNAGSLLSFVDFVSLQKKKSFFFFFFFFWFDLYSCAMNVFT